MISAFLTATVTVDGVSQKWDFGLAATDIAKQTDEELTQNGVLAGKAFAQILIKARNGELDVPDTLPEVVPPEDPTPNPGVTE